MADDTQESDPKSVSTSDELCGAVVNLQHYRDDSVLTFAGRHRGRDVAKCIKKAYGKNVKIIVPDDVLYIGTHFRAGFHEVLPKVKIPSAA